MIKRYSILLLCLALLHVSILGVAVSADDPVTVRVGMYENNPKIFTYDEGKVSGLWPDIIEYIAFEEGWEIEYVHGTWAECLGRLASSGRSQSTQTMSTTYPGLAPSCGLSLESSHYGHPLSMAATMSLMRTVDNHTLHGIVQ